MIDRTRGSGGRASLTRPPLRRRTYDAAVSIPGELERARRLAFAADETRARDLLIWDNRCMLHRVTAYRAFDEPRDLRSCRVLDIEDDGLAPRPVTAA